VQNLNFTSERSYPLTRAISRSRSYCCSSPSRIASSASSCKDLARASWTCSQVRAGRISSRSAKRTCNAPCGEHHTHSATACTARLSTRLLFHPLRGIFATGSSVGHWHSRPPPRTHRRLVCGGWPHLQRSLEVRTRAQRQPSLTPHTHTHLSAAAASLAHGVLSGLGRLSRRCVWSRHSTYGAWTYQAPSM
jgi:hypothetical protein